MNDRHKVFVSYHHANDQAYRDAFENLFVNTYDIMVSKSVQIGDIDQNLKTETVRQKIRDDYLRDSTVTVVLIGSHTWQRKHVDWEIGSSLRQTAYNSRSGLIGILLPSYYSYYNTSTYNHYSLPPRLAYNLQNGYAGLYRWTNDSYLVKSWIHEAFLRRKTIIPDNSYPSFAYNRTSLYWQ